MKTGRLKLENWDFGRKLEGLKNWGFGRKLEGWKNWGFGRKLEGYFFFVAHKKGVYQRA